jgi:hypothetical protein
MFALVLLIVSGAALAAPAPVVDRVRFFPRPEHARQMVGGRFLGSNSGHTVGFVELAVIDEAPAEGAWTELSLPGERPYRYVKYEGPEGSHGAVAEIEFYAGDEASTGRPFGVAGAREKGCTYQKALDGDTSTYFDAFLADGAYVGLDLGTEENVSSAPVLDPPPGRYAEPIRLAIRAPDPDAEILYTTDGTVPTRRKARRYGGPLMLRDGSTIVTAIALVPARFPGKAVSGAYTVGPAEPPEGLVTFSTGNSLSDTFNGWLEPVARSAGYDHEAHRFSVPGAPTDWLWNHPGKGFGHANYPSAFARLAPIDILITQPFHGHGRSIENEAEHSGNFYMLARQASPNIQLYLYQQWPGRDFQDGWAQLKRPYMKPVAEARSLQPASTWEEGVANHLAYFEALREKMDAEYPGPPVRIVPTGLALANLKRELEAGRIPGLPRDRFFELHYGESDRGPGWNIHMIEKGRYFVSLVLYCCFYGEPADRVSLPKETTTLTPEQDRVYKRVAWETVRDYRWSGVSDPAP